MLKSPIFILDSYVQRMREGTVPDAEVPAALAMISRTTAELGAQVGRLLEEVAADIRSREVRLVARDLVEEVGALIKAFIGAADGHQVRLSSSPAQLSAWIDPVLFTQVLAHLLDNAVKYSEPGTTIDLIARRSPPWAELTVRDEGVGLPDGIDVFAPFQRGGELGTPGLGLGLHIVRKLVEAMGGAITAESNPDRGASFTVILPLEESAPA
jgi:signal transduction histidine kinase